MRQQGCGGRYEGGRTASRGSCRGRASPAPHMASSTPTSETRPWPRRVLGRGPSPTATAPPSWPTHLVNT
ncbi:hypothetical protein Taro_037471 [Colocasia esculenta]|uniref:Uncharacterized protein n=1 Tax=Colocasia esculenta TaxID=4460 RepID=A0A843W5R9_COLES|nr:hypothetical protein [Colocasia esculenta]